MQPPVEAVPIGSSSGMTFSRSSCSGRHLGMFKDKIEYSGDVSLFDIGRRIEAEKAAAR